jgi:hypothetical protein
MLARFDAPNETAQLLKVLKNESAFILVTKSVEAIAI